VAINKTNFPDDNFRAMIQEWKQEAGASITTLTQAEAAYLKIIDCQNTGTFSLKGIEYFPNLETLNCSYTFITDLNLSSNTKLKNLNCNYSELSNLDISNTSLTGSAPLDCRNNFLLDIKGLSASSMSNALLGSQNYIAIPVKASGGQYESSNAYAVQAGHTFNTGSSYHSYSTSTGKFTVASSALNVSLPFTTNVGANNLSGSIIFLTGYTITYNSNGGSAVAAKTGVMPGYIGNVVGVLPTSTRSGYIFDGWFTQAVGGAPITSTTEMPKANVTYYAHWITDIAIKDVVNVSAGFQTPIKWMVDKGITSINPYNPKGQVTREQMAAFMYALAGRPTLSSSAQNVVIKDAARVSSGFPTSIKWMIYNRITSVNPYNPQGKVTREQMAAFMYSYNRNVYHQL
jgi:uncharacterized repeat protein (TIGR02543 family)